MRVANPARIAILVLGLSFVALACGDGGDGGDGGDSERSVEGVILDVESSSLVDLDSFSLRTNDGETILFVPDPDASTDPGEAIFAGHLLGHMQAAEQVTVHYREEGGVFLATRIEHD